LGKLGNILKNGLLILFSSIMLLSPLLTKYVPEDKDSVETPFGYASSQYSFSSGKSSFDSCLTNLVSEGNNVRVNLASGSGFSTCLLEKILFYSPLREKKLSRVTVKPFFLYITHLYGAQSNYFVYALREIII
jgi:hypothetical protein